jgi:hypothetical protein
MEELQEEEETVAEELNDKSAHGSARRLNR